MVSLEEAKRELEAFKDEFKGNPLKYMTSVDGNLDYSNP
jgi:hypothetical protein